jgi:parallel beta-helix repeat protein
MKTLLRSALLLLAWSAVSITSAQAQTVPTLEFFSGAGNPTGNGPTIANQVITFQANNNNPTGNTPSTYTPTTTATFALSNQQYSQPTTQLSTGTGVAFGATVNSGSGNIAAPAAALFPLLNAYGASTNANYTSAFGVNGGIDVASNRGTEIFVSAMPLPANVPMNSRYACADLTITFNRAVVNPVIHVTGLGGNYGGGIGFTTELDLLTAGVTLSRLSGSTELDVKPTQILNNAPNPNASTGTGAASGSILINTPNTGITSVSFKMYLRPDSDGGALHATDGSAGHVGDGWVISASSTAVTPITGYVFEDVNYGGGAGRPITASGASVRSGARVELYNSAGTFVSFTTTDADGQYNFNPVAGNYTVRVVNSTVTSSRPGSVNTLTPVQTYNGSTTYVGGETPTKIDAAAGTTGTTLASLNTTTTVAQSQAAVTVATGTTAVGADFGFNFSTVVNTNNSGQGSLRQFITNSNTLTNAGLDQEAFNGTPATGTTAIDPAAGTEYAIFMLNDGRTSGTALPGLRLNMTAPTGYSTTTKAFTFSGLAALPTITDNNTAIDGKLQTVLTGEGTTPTVNNLAGEIILNFSNSNRGGISVTGGNTRIASLNITGAGNLGGGTNGSRALNTTGAVLEDGVAIVFSGAGTNGSIVTDVTGFDNTVASVLLGNGAMGVTLRNNVFRTGRTVAATSTTIPYDGAGVLLSNASGNTINNNNISSNTGFGIELISASNNIISGNTIGSNGAGTNATDDAGISITSGNNNLISANTITNNSGDGIVALTGTSGNRFTENSISGNTGLGIDLSANTTATGDDVTLNASGKAAASGANGLLNFPVITQAKVSNGSLIVTGFAPAGSLVEFFIAAADPTSFGEGNTYLFNATEGSSADGDNKTSSYNTSTFVPSFDQGSETNANRFLFVFPLGAQTNLSSAKLTATATVLSTVNNIQVGNTSEFSGNITVVTGPLPVELVSFGAKAAGQNAQLTWRTAQELNNDHFVVERSFDGKKFSSVGQVQGQGTTTLATNYTFTDAQVASKTAGQGVYYRLRQVDTDGTASFSAVQVVSFSNIETTLSVSPNPASGYAAVDLSTLAEGTYQVTVRDVTGRLVHQASKGGIEHKLPAGQWPTGIYLIQVKGQAVIKTARLIKE